MGRGDGAMIFRFRCRDGSYRCRQWCVDLV